MRKLRLQIIFHVVHHTRRTTRCGRYMEPIIRNTADNTVIHYKASFIEHDTITQAAHFKLRPRVRVEKIHKFSRIGADHFDLAEC